MLDFAKELRKNGYKVFILSNNFKERTLYYREHFPEIFEAFDKAYFSWETGYVKPSEEAYKNAINQNNLKPEETVYFDDSTKNIEVAKGLGMNAYIYENPNQVKSLLSKLN